MGENTKALATIARAAGGQALPDNEQWKHRIEIRSESSTRLYTVAQRKSSGEWGCSCMGWKRYRHCKHLDRMVPMLAAAIRRGELA
jgi:hypothetical protein